MTHRLLRVGAHRIAVGLAVLTGCGCLVAGSGVSRAAADDRVAVEQVVTLAPGVTYEQFSLPVAAGEAHGYLLAADLTDSHVSVDLLTPGTVSQREPVSQMADDQGAVGGVNADFFNNSETQHPGVPVTGSAVGPAIGDGVAFKAAVPDGQRFGPAMPSGDSARDVLGIGTDKVARLDRLSLSGSVSAGGTTTPLGGFDQYALPVGSVGAYTSLWGSADRRRAVCGTDHSRSAPCSTDTYEVTVRQGAVSAVSATPGAGSIAPDTVVLVGREAGAQALRQLQVGEQVAVTAPQLVPSAGGALGFAVGGFPILRGGLPLAGLDTVTPAIRTGAGFDQGGHRLLLVSLDGDGGAGSGMTVAELADLMHNLGADSAVNLDGGGSSTVVAREPGDPEVTVLNQPTDGSERPVPEGIGIFSR